MSTNKKKAVRTRFSFICAIASSEIGKPSSRSAMARLSHNVRHVKNLFYNETEDRVGFLNFDLNCGSVRTAGENRYAISLLA